MKQNMLIGLKEQIISGWGFMRIVRLVLATIILIEGWKNSETLFAVIGGVLFFQALFNKGCCGPSGCDVNHKQKREESFDMNKEEITFEEVK